ncbi:hypothetical protein C8R45DRAFT_1223912, partial [Mycena sanguinolenta]
AFSSLGLQAPTSCFSNSTLVGPVLCYFPRAIARIVVVPDRRRPGHRPHWCRPHICNPRLISCIINDLSDCLS